MGALLSSDPVDIGPFRLIGRIGAGGMGVVYLASAAGGEKVAVKVVRSELTQDPIVRQRFLREVRAARRVRSPLTAAVIAADPEGSPPWVAFEYIDCPNLQEVVEAQVPRLSAAIGILTGIAEALVAIHQEGLIHRDLKPSNILCPHDGVKVIDFGIAAARESTSLTGSGVIGTPAWLSPEQIMGHTQTNAVDVFAWGCVAVYTLTGRLPFGGYGDVAEAVLYRIMHAPVVLDRVPRQLVHLVSAALAKDPRDRPSVTSLLEALLPAGERTVDHRPNTVNPFELQLQAEASASVAKSVWAPLSGPAPGKPKISIPSGIPPTELQITDILDGDGAVAHPGMTLTVHYVGASYSTGREFDASWNRRVPFKFSLGGGQVIAGWDEGLVGMKVGGRRQLIIPPSMGYGVRGAGSVIKPNETLIFIVDLLQF